MSDQEPITVVVRARGRTQQEIDAKSPVVVGIQEEGGNKLFLNYNGDLNPSDQLDRKIYEFDKVFGPNSDQSTIFDTVATPLFDDFLKGYNSTILVYGMTSSGKTYTMTGESSTSKTSDLEMHGIDDLSGIIPRVLSKLFEVLNEGNNQDDYLIKCSFLELYKEELRDLLNSDSKKQLKIYDIPNAEGSSVMVQNLEEVILTDAKAGLATLNKGLKLRQVGSTKMNEYSSRSHTIFTLTLFKQQPSGELFKVSKMNLVDLAGSENIRRSGAEDQRALEAFSINQSLLTLGRVISLLVDKSHTHIPYRDSKLTRLLKDSLGGGTKTCLIATISPARINFDETVSTLEYATKAKGIQNKPQVGINVSKDLMVKDLSAELISLKRDLQANKNEDGVFVDRQNYQNLMNDLTEYKTKVQENAKKSEVLMKQNDLLRSQLSDCEKHVKEQTNNISSLSSELETLRDKNEKRKENQKSLISSSGKMHEILNRLNESLLTFKKFELMTKEAISSMISTQLEPIDDLLKEALNSTNETPAIEKNVDRIGELQAEIIGQFKSKLEDFYSKLINSNAEIPDLVKEFQTKVENLSNTFSALTENLSKSLSSLSHDNNQLKYTIDENLFKNHDDIVEKTIEATNKMIESDSNTLLNKFLTLLRENNSKQQETVKTQVESMLARLINVERGMLSTNVEQWDSRVKQTLNGIDLSLSKSHTAHTKDILYALDQIQTIGDRVGDNSRSLGDHMNTVVQSLDRAPAQQTELKKSLESIQESHQSLILRNSELLQQLRQTSDGLHNVSSDLKSKIINDTSTRDFNLEDDARRLQDLESEQKLIKDQLEAGKTPLRSESVLQTIQDSARNLGEAPKFTLLGSRYSDINERDELKSQNNTSRPMDPPLVPSRERTTQPGRIKGTQPTLASGRGMKRKQSDGTVDGTQVLGGSNKFQRVGESRVPIIRKTRFR
ncbi:hypothetical protein WICPIJ_006389 [Wickerhamomyces pijperi]|uniref:Kinesin-like protein n=1 Tax=Wickerhamomyces pijperi TaxID=599730 RepID=A0A9P8Q4C6_WICPI|nr:hypothetical protein WICPIJ_006389 [Wickerhamomyces pijperi]